MASIIEQASCSEIFLLDWLLHSAILQSYPPASCCVTASFSPCVVARMDGSTFPVHHPRDEVPGGEWFREVITSWINLQELRELFVPGHLPLHAPRSACFRVPVCSVASSSGPLVVRWIGMISNSITSSLLRLQYFWNRLFTASFFPTTCFPIIG